MIPFSPPHIDEDMIKEVVDTLRSGWITSGPKVRQFEEAIGKYISVDHVLCVNAATSGLELILRWYGIGKGDEVIVPAYTYCATANVILHCGATPVMVDVNSDFNMDMKSLRKTITPNTKAIIPVDIAGLPCDYDELFDIIGEQDIADLFQATTSEQKALGRVLILADAAHSLGAVYKGKRSGTLADISVFSFHAVKNLTTAEGGAICLHLTKSFDNKVVKEKLRILSLHGQNKDALAKTLSNNWEYDVMEAGYKYNMTDISAAIGLVGLAKYDTQILKRRREIFERYNEGFGDFDWAEVPVSQTEDKLSSFHVYLLRIKSISEEQRNTIIQDIFEKQVSVNVHFKPLPLLTLYKRIGYKMEDFPKAYDNFIREISLPVYVDLTNEQVDQVIASVSAAINQNI